MRTTRRRKAVATRAPVRDTIVRAAPDRMLRIGGAVVAFVVATAYVRTAARDIVFGDSPELTGAAATLGVAHPPGYPIWTILGHVFTLIPVGTIPFRVSLFSVAAGVACAVLIYLTAHRLTGSVIASASAAVLVAFVPVVWAWSVVPEVFALADALAAALIYCLLRWHQDGRDRAFLAAAFVGGLGMAHHQTIVLLAPAVLFLMWEHRRQFRGGGLLVRATVAFVAGLVPYVYILIDATRHPAWNWSEISSISDWVGHILRVGYGTGSLVTQTFQGGTALDRLLTLARSFTVVEALLVSLGLVALFRRDRAWFLFTAIAAAISGPLFVAYTNINTAAFELLQSVLERFFMLSHVMLGPVAALGLVTLASALTTRARALRAPAELALSAAALGVAVVIALGQWRTLDVSDSRLARTFAEDILGTIRPNALVLAAGDAVVSPIGYLRTIEGARPDLTFIQMPLLPADWYVRQLRREYPTLVIRFDRLDGIRGTLRTLVESNGVERFDVAGVLVDDSLSGNYGLYRRGIVQELRPKQIAVDIDAVAAENETLLRSYHIVPIATLTRPWDRLILADYAYIAYDVGDLYERSQKLVEARRWYERALSIDPNLLDAHTALARLPP